MSGDELMMLLVLLSPGLLMSFIVMITFAKGG